MRVNSRFCSTFMSMMLNTTYQAADNVIDLSVGCTANRYLRSKLSDRPLTRKLQKIVSLTCSDIFQLLLYTGCHRGSSFTSSYRGLNHSTPTKAWLSGRWLSWTFISLRFCLPDSIPFRRLLCITKLSVKLPIRHFEYATRSHVFLRSWTASVVFWSPQVFSRHRGPDNPFESVVDFYVGTVHVIQISTINRHLTNHVMQGSLCTTIQVLSMQDFHIFGPNNLASVKFARILD